MIGVVDVLMTDRISSEIRAVCDDVTIDFKWMKRFKKGCNLKKIAALEILNGAEGETRTRTAIRPLDPEPSASTNSATSATR
jgi:hypothetical protein